MWGDDEQRLDDHWRAFLQGYADELRLHLDAEVAKRSPLCGCTCHYVVREGPNGKYVAGGTFPRMNDSMAAVEACGLCARSHQIAASDDDIVTHMVASEEESLAIFNMKRRKV